MKRVHDNPEICFEPYPFRYGDFIEIKKIYQRLKIVHKVVFF